MRLIKSILVATLSIALVTIAFSGTVHAKPFNPETPPHRETGWANDQTIHFFALAIGVPANPASYEEFFIIAPINPAQPQGREIFGPHDHTLTDTSNARDHDYTAVWIILLAAKGPQATGSNVRSVVNMVDTNLDGTPDTPIAFVSHADINGDGTLEPLTSVHTIEAAENAGLVTPLPTGVAFICPTFH